MKKNIIAIVGPTAVGKTALSIEMAKAVGGEIVCVDSLLVYRDFNIGTAKPTQGQQEEVPHHLIDIVSPIEKFTAGDFCRAAQKVISDIESRGKQVFLVGGSGLYFRALMNGMFHIPMVDSRVKDELMKQLHKDGISLLYQELDSIDPQSAKNIHPHDTYRILRALEVYRGTGKKLSEYREEYDLRKKREEKKIEVVKIGLDLPRAELHEKIFQRTKEMIQNGLIEEVGSLRKKYPAHCKPFQSVGYTETLSYLESGSSDSGTREGLVKSITQHTRALARRQLTWFRSDHSVRWINPESIMSDWPASCKKPSLTGISP